MRLATIIAGAMQLSTISALSAAAKLRAVLQAPGAVLCPGVHDALSTRVFAEAGANVLFLSGFGVSACRGEPDAGILTRVEMEEVARQCVAAAGGVPLIVDGDTGFGGASNLRRTVHGFAAAGAAAVSIEDQQFPKRCTFQAGSGVRVVDRDAAVARVRTALKARATSRGKRGATSSSSRGPIAARRWAWRRPSRAARPSRRSAPTSSTPRISRTRRSMRS